MKIKHVYGNVLKLDIPLTIKIRTIEGGAPSERKEPFYPDATKGCVVELANNYNRKVEYEATIQGNVAHIEDMGKISIGQYKVTVKCYDTDGNPYRYMVRDIVEICDATADAGIEAGVEFNAETYTLEGAVFVSYGVEQVQSDWAETDPEEKSFIKNKPNHIVTDEHYVHTDNNYTDEEKEKLADLENYDDSGIRQELDGKVDKVQGKGLSTNDFTNEDKSKLNSALQSETDPTVPQWAKQPNKPTYTAQDVGALPNSTKYGSTIDLAMDSATYVLTLSLKDQDGTVLNTKTVDLPIESVVVNGRYDAANKKIVLTLQSGSTIDVPVGDLIAGLQTEITSVNMLDADLVDDTNSTHKFVTAQEKQTWNDKSDFSGSYNDLSDKPTIPTTLSQLSEDTTHRTVSDAEKTAWGNKQETLVSGTNIKTINNESILGGGNIAITGEVYVIDNTPQANSNHLVSSGGVASEIVWDVTARNSNATFASLSALLSDASLDTLIPTTIRRGGMQIRFVCSSDNKYIQARCMALNFTTDVTQWQGVDAEPSEGSINLVESGGVFDKIDDIVNGTKSYQSLSLVSYSRYINSNNIWADSNYMCKFKIGNLAETINEIKIIPNENTSCILAFVKKISGGAPSGAVEYKNGTSGLITITKPTTFKVNEECSLYLYSRTSASETTHLPSDVLRVIRTKEEITVNTEHVIDESSNKTQQQINTEQSATNIQFNDFDKLTLNEILAEYNNKISVLNKVATSNSNIITDNQWSSSSYIQRKLDLTLMSPCLLEITPVDTLNIAFVESLGDAGTSVQYTNNTDSVIHLTGKRTFFVKDKCILYIERKINASDTEHIPSEVYIYQKNEFIWNNIVGEKLTIIGDSISAGAGASIPSRAYAPQLCSKYRAVSNNLSISGSCIGYGDNRFVNRLTQENMADSKLVIVWGGTNDFTRQVIIGDYYGEESVEPTTYGGNKKMIPNSNTNEFSGALHNLIQTIQNYCPATPILFITPLKRAALTAESVLASDTCNRNGDFLKDYVKAIKEVCDYYSIPVLDMYGDSQLNPLSSAWTSYFSSDGLHPNDNGHRLIANIIFKFIDNNIII